MRIFMKSTNKQFFTRETQMKGQGNVIIDDIYKKMMHEVYNAEIDNQHDLQIIKNRFSAKYGFSAVPNVELIRIYSALVDEGKLDEKKALRKLLRKRGVRSQSGIVNITLLTKAHPCPGKCIFCPTEPKMPKSYISTEPAMMRAVLNEFDAFRQVENRITSLHITGHFTDKVDVVVSGGTFSFYHRDYQEKFTCDLFNALNAPINPTNSLEKAQKNNETAENRCIGLSFETRPDHVNEEELLHLRKLGCTKIEIGIQSLNDDVLEANKRGHGIAEVQQAMKLMKDAGFKVNAHMMPNLLGSNPEIDLADMRELFNNPAYKPDWLKVYPCMVVPWSQLADIYDKGEYKSYSDEVLVDLLVQMHEIWPEYVRVTRIYRDIPTNIVISGSKFSNLRQIVEAKCAEKGLYSRDIRSREIKDAKICFDDLEFRIVQFDASGGQEFFLSYDHVMADKLCALLRLRFPSYLIDGKPHFIPELEGAAIVREVHTYGEQVEISKRDGEVSQHIGLGKRLMKKAEEITLEHGYHKIAVIAGIGVREYYRKLGYNLEGTYMVKYL